MGFQVLQAEDEQGNIYQLAVEIPGGGFGLQSHDPAAFELMRSKFAASKTLVGDVAQEGAWTLLTPAAGNYVQVKWVRFKSIGNNGTNKFTLMLGDEVVYSETLDELDAWQHGAIHEGAVDAPLRLQTSTGQYLEYNIEYQELEA